MLKCYFGILDIDMIHDDEELDLCGLSNSYTMGCPTVRGDNPRALASGLSYVQVDKHGMTIKYHLHQCRPCTSRHISLAHHDIFRAKVGKGGCWLVL